MSGLWRGLGAILLCAQLAGCAALSLLAPAGPAPTTYDLSARAGVRNLAASDSRLGIRTPNAVQTFDNQRIVYRPEAGRVAYYAGAQWTDRLPRLIEAQLIESFDAAGARTVTRITDALTVDYQLLSEVRDFSVSRKGTGQSARVSIYVQLVSDSKGLTLTGRLFTARVSVSGKAASTAGSMFGGESGDDGTAAGVAALNRAFAQVLAAIVRWTLPKMSSLDQAQ